MPKASVYDVNPIDPRVLLAAQKLADEVQPMIEEMATKLARDWGERPAVVAVAISETLYRVPLREDVTRWLAVAAEQEEGYGVTETRDAIGRLAGFSRTGIERRLGLVEQARKGRYNWTPRELRDAVIVEREREREEWLADEADIEALVIKETS